VDALQLVHLCCASVVIAEIVFLALNGLVVDLGHIKLCFAFIELKLALTDVQFALIEFNFSLILTKLHARFIVFLDDFFILLLPQLIDHLVIVRHSFIDGHLLDLLFDSASDQSVDCLLFVKGKSW
jgi:hypothetical protein